MIILGKKHSKHHGSMNYDEKERLMIAHYFGLLAENNFTEYDILGFLMVLRQNWIAKNINTFMILQI